MRFEREILYLAAQRRVELARVERFGARALAGGRQGGRWRRVARQNARRAERRGEAILALVGA